jgi:DNA adenine methylase
LSRLLVRVLSFLILIILAIFSDTNADLINTYQYLQNEGKIFIDYCESFFMPQYNTEHTFYELRNQFNLTTDLRLKAALFIYINKHCYNGLCRYNSKGGFNTPFGKYAKPYFPGKEMIYFSEKSRHAEFIASDFVSTLHSARQGDVVYCDPPYVPLSNTSNFTSYSQGGFNHDQQKLLAKMAEQLVQKGITVIISNHHTDFTEDIYQQASIISFDVQRFISCSGSNRNKVKEMLAIFSA